MQFNVAQLLKQSIGSTRRYELNEDISGLDPDLVVLGPLVGDVQLMRIHSGILVNATVSTAVRVVCNGCLEPIAVPVRFLIEESFRPLTEVNTGRYILPEEFEGSEDDLEDAALLIDEQHILDLIEVVRQNIWLALPMYPGCNWTGTGDCPNLVAYQRDLSNSQEDIAISVVRPDDEIDDKVDPRWAALLKLKDTLEDSE